VQLSEGTSACVFIVPLQPDLTSPPPFLSPFSRTFCQIEKLEFQFEGTDGKGSLNFAEAALLIQGTTCIYSKKVEHLYALVYETLDLLASTKKLAQSSSLGADGEDLDTVGISQTDVLSFLPLDDIAEDGNIDLDDGGLPSASVGVPRMPLVLVPLTEGEKQGDSTLMTRQGVVFGNRSDFKMNTSIVHESGTLLLGVEDALFLDHSFLPLVDRAASRLSGEGGAADTSMAAMGDDDDDNGGWADDGNDDDFGAAMNDEDGGNGEEDMETVAGNNAGGDSAGSGGAHPTVTAATDAPEKVDAWAPLDPHAFSGEAPKASRRIKSYRVPTSVNASAKKSKAAAMQPLSSISDFCADTMFLIAGNKSAPRSGNAAPAYPEFANLFWAEKKRRAAEGKSQNPAQVNQKSASTQGLAAWASADAGNLSAVSMAPEQAFDDYDGNDEDGGDFGGYDGNDDDGFDMVGLGDNLAMPDIGAAPDFAAAAGSQANKAAMSYEDLVRAHIESYVAESQRCVALIKFVCVCVRIWFWGWVG
jgi:condensin-2 complex subunit H2